MSDWISDFGRWWDDKIGRKVDHVFGQQPKPQNKTALGSIASTPYMLKTPTWDTNEDKKPFRWGAGEEGIRHVENRMRPTSSSGMSVDEKRDLAMANRAPGLQPVTDSDRMASIDWQKQQLEQDSMSQLMDQLLGGMMGEFGGLDRSRVDYSPLDKALQSKLAHLNQVRGQTNQNFDKNDLALEQMHRAYQNDIATKGRAEFQDIGQDEIAGHNANSTASINALQAIKNEDAAKRAAMLKNLGQTQLAGTADPNAAILTEGQAAIGRRNDANVTEARGNQAANEAFNQTVATSVGQQGAESRAALTQQLQGILGKLGLVETGYQNDYANQRAELDQRAEAMQYDQFRNRQGFLSDTYKQMQDDVMAKEQMAAEERIRQQEMQQKVPQLDGFGGFANNLIQSGYNPQEVSRGLGSLSDILNSQYLPEGYDPNAGYRPTDIILRKLREAGVDPMLALEIAKGSNPY